MIGPAYFFSLLQKCILPATLFKYFLAAGLVLVCAKNASFYSEEEFFSKICPFSFFHISFLSRFNIMYISSIIYSLIHRFCISEIAIHLDKLVNALPISFFDPYLAFHIVSLEAYVLFQFLFRLGFYMRLSVVSVMSVQTFLSKGSPFFFWPLCVTWMSY